jgi:23S rRNA (uracil1939-C5)-methyltransferase
MGGKKQKFHKFIENLEIVSAGAEGHSIGRYDNQVVFVKYAAPGDIVDVRVINKRKKFLEGQIIRFHQQSPQRIEPFCTYFTQCGGCKWQHLSYDNQLQFKQQQVIDALERLGGVQGFEVLPIVGSSETTAYRNKLELTFSDRAWQLEFDANSDKPIPKALGFHMPGQFNKLLDIEYCHLMPEYVNTMQRGIKDYCITNNVSFHDIVKHEGLMRNIIFRCNTKGEWMILVSFYKPEMEHILGVMDYIKHAFQNVVSLVYVINEKQNDTLTGCEVIVYDGAGYLTETLADKTYKIHPLSFFQTNSKQAKVLYDLTKQFAGLSGNELVYDLYTGTGSIAIYIADLAKKVVGIEYVEEAIVDAKANALLNGVSNCDFYAGDMKEVLSLEFIEEHGKPDVVITDPPRDGMHPDVVKKLLETAPERIVYVSCNPATQARDAKLLAEKYTLVKIQPVDMFPHTHHVENIALFKLN